MRNAGNRTPAYNVLGQMPKDQRRSTKGVERPSMLAPTPRAVRSRWWRLARPAPGLRRRIKVLVRPFH